jgi:uncharacterized protein
LGKLPSREQATKILFDNKCSPQVVSHCLAVADFALEVAAKLKQKGFGVDLELVEAGAVLHDIGRAKSHGVDHSLEGSKIASELGLPQPLINVIKRHIGAGITAKEADELGWPQDIYVPQTLEEKIVCYADKRIDHGKVVPIEVEIGKLESKGFTDGAERVRSLHVEITGLLGEQV